MCSLILPETEQLQWGGFDKRGDGNMEKFPVLIAYCACKLNLFGRVPGNTIYTQVEEIL